MAVKAIFSILVVIVIAIVMLVRGGVMNRAAILLAGAIVSLVGLLAYTRLINQEAAGETKRSWGRRTPNGCKRELQ